MNNSINREIRTIFLPVKPFSVASNGADHEFGGIISEMINLMGAKLNINFRMNESEDWVSFSKTNGKWKGVMRELQNQEVDLIVGPMVLGPDYVDDFYVLPPYYQEPSFWTFASTSRNKPSNFFSFLMTFDIEIWYGIMVTLVALIFVSTLSDYLTIFASRFRKSFREILNDYFWIYLAASFNEGSAKNPSTMRTKFTLAVWLLAMIVLLNSFSGQFKALLLISQGGDTMSNVHDLAMRPDLIPHFPDYYSLYQCLRDTEMESYKKIWKSVEKHGVTKSAFHISEFHKPNIYQTMKDGKAVIIADSTLLKVNYAKLCQDVKGPRLVYHFEGVCSMFFFTFLAAPTLDKNIVQTVHKGMRWMMEGHLVDKWLNDESRDLWKCFLKSDHNEATPLSIGNLFGAFALLFILQLGAVFIFIVEIVQNKLSQLKANKNKLI